MGQNELRYGIVGCAGMGTNHADAVVETDGAHLVACSDIDDEIAQSFATRYETEWYTDHRTMAVKAGLDAVSICTPNGTHTEIVSDLAAEDVDVLCEKPLDVTPARIDRLADACEQAGITFGCVLQRRTLGGPRLARDVLMDGRLGDLVLGSVEVKWHRDPSYYEDVAWHGTTDLDGGVLLTQALHGIDLLQWTTGGIERVAARTATVDHDIDVPDTAVATVEFANGGYGQITGSTAVYPQEPITLELRGTKGTLRWHEDRLESFETVDGADGTPESFPLGTDHLGLVRDFVAAIREDRAPAISLEEARKTHDVVFAIEAAAERDEWVDVAEVREDGR